MIFLTSPNKNLKQPVSEQWLIYLSTAAPINPHNFIFYSETFGDAFFGSQYAKWLDNEQT